ncbi:eukaryotic translation initiation factor 4E-1A isoform X1 [Tachysurus fulvidraco]|uniref:eukaryotic translation initiation factor 4E-1A isoform X1 n=1 Tax=Tachysurus fulvidraco TaxID=1234273 RepID=UPI001FED8207|nr:eukaryotic translation initiation factor 4E-1A isoform X1 [Tachysurus fulvidraco]
MATAEPEVNQITSNTEEEQNEAAGQEIVNPEDYIKHPLQNRWALWFFKNDKSKTWQANLRLISKFDTVEDFWALYNHIQLSSNLMSGCDYSLFKVSCFIVMIALIRFTHSHLYTLEVSNNECRNVYSIGAPGHKRACELKRVFFFFFVCFVFCFVLPSEQDGIEPMWEDERNKRGGRWLITLTKQQRRADLDRFWLETLLCLVGEAFDDHSDDVCGAVVNVRTKGDKIAIWTTDYENKDAIVHIGRVYKERLGVPSKVIIGYQSHADTATKSGSTTKNKFVV